jgi:hypothetical protein
MIPHNAPPGNRLNQAMVGLRQWLAGRLATPVEALPLQRSNLAQLARSDAQLPALVAACPVAMRYLHLLGPLDWEHFPERDPHRPWPGTPPAPRAPYVAAYLIKLDQDKRYMSGLRRYLVEHPALVWVLGFPLVASQTSPWGFDVEASVPSRKQLGRVLRKLPNACLQFLLTSAVSMLQQELPAEANFGDAVSLDTKHILAWVRENNPKDYVPERFNPDRQPKGDPDCKLGCKRKRNRRAAEGNGGEGGNAPPAATASAAPTAPPAAPSTAAAAASSSPATLASDPKPASTIEVGEYYWGYASGVVATKVGDWGEFVLAEFTQTFDKGDATYFFPLMKQVEERLGHRPRYGALDMAFDAHYVYQYFHEAGGFAAVPLAERGNTSRQFDAAGLPLCAAGLSMPLKGAFTCNSTHVQHQRGRYVCPLLALKHKTKAGAADQSAEPGKTSQLAIVPQMFAVCPVDDAHWAKGGCVVTMPTSEGARIRYQLDRQSEAYKTIYKQRTADERVNSQALELGTPAPALRSGACAGVERPKLRNEAAIINQNTLTYVLINLRGLHRVQARKAGLARQEQPLTGR